MDNRRWTTKEHPRGHVVGRLQPVIRILAIALLVTGGILALGCGAATPQPLPSPGVVVVTVLVTTTPAPMPTQTPRIVTVVVTATPESTGEEGAPTPGVAQSTGPTTPAAATAVAANVQPTAPPQTEGFKYAAPEIIGPEDGARFGKNYKPILEWRPVAAGLAPDEYYEVTIERTWQGKLYYAGSDWTRDTRFIPSPDVVRGTSDLGDYHWWVVVKRLTGTDEHGGKQGVALSPPSKRYTFYWK